MERWVQTTLQTMIILNFKLKPTLNVKKYMIKLKSTNITKD